MELQRRSRLVRLAGLGMAGSALSICLAATAPAASASSVPSSAWKDTMSTGGTASCITGPDQTAQFQALVNSVPDGTPSDPTVISLAPGACYVIDQTVTLDRRSNIIIEGNANDPATFYRQGVGTCPNPYYCHIFFLWGGSNITFTNVNVESDNIHHAYSANNAGEAAWWVWGTQGLTLTHDTVSDVWGDFATLGPDTYRNWEWTNDVTMTNDNFNGSGRQGISLTGAGNVVISNDVITNAALSNIDIEADSGTGPDFHGVPTYGGSSNVTITDNLIGPGGTTFLSNYGYCSVDTNITVSHNTLEAGRTFELWSKACPSVPRSGWTITDNTATSPLGSPRGAIEFTYVENSTVSGNTIPLYTPQGGTAVKVWGSSNIAVENNRFPGAPHIDAIDPPVWSGPASTNITVTGNSTN